MLYQLSLLVRTVAWGAQGVHSDRGQSSSPTHGLRLPEQLT